MSGNFHFDISFTVCVKILFVKRQLFSKLSNIMLLDIYFSKYEKCILFFYLLFFCFEYFQHLQSMTSEKFSFNKHKIINYTLTICVTDRHTKLSLMVFYQSCLFIQKFIHKATQDRSQLSQTAPQVFYTRRKLFANSFFLYVKILDGLTAVKQAYL